MSQLTTTDQPFWYAVYTKPREEDRAESNLRAWGMKTFMPMIKDLSGKEKIRHLFPRYIFAYFNPNSELHKVNYTRGVCGVVRFGDTPCPVDDFIIETIMSQMGQEGFIRFEKESIRRGDKVTIQDGPFKALSGTVDHETSDSERLVVLLSSVSYQGRIMIEKALLKKVALDH